MGKLRVGVVGFGQIGPVHVRSYQQLSDKVEVAAVVDVDPARRELAQQDYAVKEVLDDYRQLLVRDDIDIIDVCIPTYLHRELVTAAAQAGKHVFCEKPMAMSLEDAVEMEEICRRQGSLLQLGFVRRFDHEWLKFREVVTDGRLGRPVVWRSVSAGMGAPTPWFFRRELGGGPFMDGAIHNYDFGNFMFGPVKQVSAHGTMIQPGRSVMDTGVAVIEYQSGDILQMMWSWGLKRGCVGSNAHDVLGEEGALLFKASDRDPLIQDDATIGHLTIKRPAGEEEDVPYERNDMFRDELESFVDCVAGGKQPLVTGQHGIEALRVALAVLQSAETGKTVKLS